MGEVCPASLLKPFLSLLPLSVNVQCRQSFTPSFTSEGGRFHRPSQSPHLSVTLTWAAQHGAQRSQFPAKAAMWQAFLVARRGHPAHR